jgi:hypothetical protein
VGRRNSFNLLDIPSSTPTTQTVRLSRAQKAKPRVWQRIASEITPQEIDRWFSSRFKTSATANRYRAFLSLVYREAIRNGKIDTNPARLVRQRKEGGGRLRFLSVRNLTAFTL